jgi:hypothetical protein
MVLSSRCIELNLEFETKSAAVACIKERGYPSFIQKTLNKALKSGGLAVRFCWESVKC